MPTLRASCTRACIIAHKEDVHQLRSALELDGFEVEEIRGPYTTEQARYSLAMRCLVNHANAWRKIAAGGEPVIVVEADFVPVREFGLLPLPFPYTNGRDDAKFGWLYSGGSILYGFDRHGFPHGHGNTTVAYVTTPAAAERLLAFLEREVNSDRTGGYRMWETYVGVFMRREAGILNHLPIYQYGEHGGIPNPEHGKAGVRSWHQADILWRRLAFLPAYARGRKTRYWAIRLRAWARGIARLLTFRFFDPRFVNADSSRGRYALADLAIARMLHVAHFHVKAIRATEKVWPL